MMASKRLTYLLASSCLLLQLTASTTPEPWEDALGLPANRNDFAYRADLSFNPMQSGGLWNLHQEAFLDSENNSRLLDSDFSNGYSSMRPQLVR